MPNRQSLAAVGYQDITARSGFNFYTPIFRNINAQVDENGLKLMDMQEIQLDDSVSAQMANLQRRDKDGASTEMYIWFDKATAFAFGLGDGSRGVWVTELWGEINPPIMLTEGDAVQVSVGTATGVKIKNSGEVSDGDIIYISRAGFNFVGNAYPSKLNMQNIQLDDSVSAQMANLQRRDKDGASTEMYIWFDKATAFAFGLGDGSRGVWVTESWGAIDPPIMLEPGEAVQVASPTAKSPITVLSPIEL